MSDPVPWLCFACHFDRPAKGELRPEARRLMDWHRQLTDRQLTDRRRGAGPYKALRARLKRLQVPGEALFAPGFVSIFEQLFPDPKTRQAALRREDLVAGLARVAIVAARVDRNPAQRGLARSLAQQMLGPYARIKTHAVVDSVVSPLRFRRLVSTVDRDAAMQAWQRLIPLFQTEHEGVNLPQLAQAVLHWNEDTRRALSFAYFATAADPPRRAAAETETAETETAES